MPASGAMDAKRMLWALVGLSMVSYAEALGSGHLPFYALFFLFIFWGLCFLGIWGIFATLRSNNKKGFEEAKAAGKITEDDEDSMMETDTCDDEAEEASAIPFMSFPLAEVSHQMGLDASLYLAHAFQLGKFWAFHFCTTGIILIITYQAAGTRGFTKNIDTGNITLDGWTDFYSFSYGALYCERLKVEGNQSTKIMPDEFDTYKGELYDDCSMAMLVPVFMSLWMVVSGVIFAAYRQKLMDAIKIEADGENVHSSVFTVMLRGVDLTTEESDFQTWFDDSYPDQVPSIHIALNLTELSQNVRGQDSIARKMNKLAEVGEDREKYESFKPALKALKDGEPALRKIEETSTGIIFVSFDTEVNARQFIVDHKAGTVADGLDIAGAKCQLAPLACDMYWENIAVTRAQRYVFQLETWTLTAVFFGIFIFFACLMVFFIGFDYMEILYGAKGLPAYSKYPRGLREGFFNLFGKVFGFILFYGVCVTVLALAFLIMEEEIPVFVKYFCKMERYMSKTKKQGAYMFKCYLHYIVYHLVISTFFLWLLQEMVQVNDGPRLFMEISGCFHCNRMMLTVAVVDAFHWCEGVKFFRRPVAAVEEDDQEVLLMSAEAADDEDDAIDDAADAYFNNKFNYSRNYAESTAVFGAASYYCIAHPMIMAYTCIYFFGKYTLDKFQIVNQYSKPHFAYGRRARSTTTYLLCSMVAGRLGEPFYFFVVKPNTLFGILFFIVFLLSFMALLAYTYRNQIFKKDSSVGKKARGVTRKATGRKDGSAAKQAKIDMLKEDGESTPREDFLETYEPPCNESLVPKVEVAEWTGAPDTKIVDNPLGDTDSELTVADEDVESGGGDDGGDDEADEE